MFKKGNKGITLIALVITIIVLLILAGVTIAQITSQDSAPQKAAEAKRANEIGAAKDEATMLASNYVQEYMEKKYVQNIRTEEALPEIVGDYVAQQFSLRASNEGSYDYSTEGRILTITSKTANEELAIGTIMDDGIITWGEETISEASVWRGLASEDETYPNLFEYKILTEPETAKVEGVQELEKVADNTGTVKISKNQEKVGTCCISGVNWDYIINDLNIAYRESVHNWIRFKTDVDIPYYIKKLVLPEKVRLDEEGKLSENGKLYTVTSFGDPGNGGNGNFHDLTTQVEELIFPSTITTITNHQWIEAKNLYLPPNLNSTPYVERCTNVYFTGGVFPTSGDIGHGGGRDNLTFVSFEGDFDFNGEGGRYIFSEHRNPPLSVNMNIKGMKKVPSFLFADADYLDEVVLGGSIEELDEYAIHQSTIQKLILPNSLKKIHENAFGSRTTIKEVHFNGTEEEFTNILNYEKLYDVTDTIYVNGQLWEIPSDPSSSSSSSSSSDV